MNHSFKAQYDELNRLISSESQNGKVKAKSFFSYNDLSQLLSEKGIENNVYTCDSLDNKTSINGIKCIYNSLNQLISHSTTQYFYDLQGTLKTKLSDQERTCYESNILSEIQKIEKFDKTKLLFLHDPIGRRQVKQHTDAKGKKIISSEKYVYFGNQEVGMIDEKGKIMQLRIPGIIGNEFSMRSISIELDGKHYVPLHDTGGNLTELVDPALSSVVESYAYSAFGQEKIFDSVGNPTKQSLIGNPWRYAEKRFDTETGLIFFGRRYYDPEIGLWISPDPSNLDGPNPYTFLHNNPINHFDRFGLSTENQPEVTKVHFMYDNTTYDCYYWGTKPNRYCICKNSSIKERGYSNQLPKITYDDGFENRNSCLSPRNKFYSHHYLHNFYERSKVYDLNLPDSGDLGIGFINGMNNTFKQAYDSVSYISKLAGGSNVHAVYNATHGITTDLSECAMGLNYIATEPVRQLHKMWNSFFDKTSFQSKFLMICHSQGAIHLRNALLDYPENLRSRILVVAIAPASYIYQQTCAKVIHYRASEIRDIVPRFDQEGANRSKGTIKTLKSHPEANFMDHDFISPTYKARLREHIDNYTYSKGQKL